MLEYSNLPGLNVFRQEVGVGGAKGARVDGGMAKHSATPFDLGPRCDPRVFIFEYFLFSFFFIPPSSWRAASAPLVCRILFTNPQASEQESKRKRERERERERERNRHEFFCSKKKRSSEVDRPIKQSLSRFRDSPTMAAAVAAVYYHFFLFFRL